MAQIKHVWVVSSDEGVKHLQDSNRIVHGVYAVFTNARDACDYMDALPDEYKPLSVTKEKVETGQPASLPPTHHAQ